MSFKQLFLSQLALLEQEDRPLSEAKKFQQLCEKVAANDPVIRQVTLPKTLNIVQIVTESPLTAELLKLLFKSLMFNTHVDHLDIKSAYLTISDVQDLKELLRHNTTIRSLVVRTNSKARNLMVSVISTMETIESLILKPDKIGLEKDEYHWTSLEAAFSFNLSITNFHGPWRGTGRRIEYFQTIGKSMFERNKILRKVIRKTILTLISIRKFRREECGLLGQVPKEIVLQIAKDIWKSRGRQLWRRLARRKDL